MVCHFCKRLMFRPWPHTENYKQWQVEEIHRELKCHTFDSDLEEYRAYKSAFEEAVGQNVQDTPEACLGRT